MNDTTLTKFIRQDIAGMDEYTPVSSLWDLSEKFNQKPEEVIKVDAGENPFGYSSKVAKALGSSNLFNYYPDSEYKELRQSIAKYAVVSKKNIMVSSGSDELLDLILRLILDEADKVVSCPPTFGMYSVLTKLNKGQLVSVPRNNDFSLDIKGIKKALDNKVKVIIICSPNNPTGNVSPKNEIIELLETGKLVIVDEAYFEFCGKTVAPLLSKYKNLIVLRTFSKWAGLAGLRLGYGIMSPFFVNQLLKIKSPYNVNLAANIAGITALKDLSYSRNIIQKIIIERERVRRELSKLSYLAVYPSQTNSLFIKLNADISKLRNYLENKKIAIRYYPSLQAVRLSIGTPDQNTKVISALKEFQSKKINCDSVIFDIDGVLVDVSKSYRQAIKKTVEYILQKNFGIRTIVTPEDIEAMKEIPGFNNDWDLSFALITLVSQGIKIQEFANKVTLINEQIRKSKDYQKTKDIFQSFYLGKKLFYEIYKRKPPIDFKKGLITNESLLLKLDLLNALSKKYKLGTATSRPRFEALFALRNLEITPNFIKEENIVAQEDTLKEKPEPDSLLEAKRRMEVESPVYVGDSINDSLAAEKANMPCIFVSKSTVINKLKEELL